MQSIEVPLGEHAYTIRIESGLLSRFGELLHEIPDLAAPRRALLVVDEHVAQTHGSLAQQSLTAHGYDIITQQIAATERSKSLATVSAMYETMLANRLDRSSTVIALGGGVIGDIAGFAAATYLRGVPVVQVPTTLLAMVDASIGGKTGVNFPLPTNARGDIELGKNLIGAFWQPRAVIIDPNVLATLPLRHLRCGLAESVKHAIVADAELFDFIEHHRDAILALDAAIINDLIARSARVKVAIVADDEREAGRRALLNLGHTFAHVIEPLEIDDKGKPIAKLEHGEAVAIGLCAASHCAVQLGRLQDRDAMRITKLLNDLGLPTQLSSPIDCARLIEAMMYDKKTKGGVLRLVLPCAIGEAAIVSDVPHEVIERSWQAVGAGG